MAKIRIKRSAGSSAPSSSDLANAELAFAEGSEILYYGKGTSGDNASQVAKIGGSGAFCDLTTAQTVAGDKTFSDDVTVSGNLTVNGTTTTVSTTNTAVKDHLMELNNGASSNANDCGLLIERGSTGDNAFIGWDESADKFTLGTTTDTATSTGNLTVSTGTLVANLEGAVTGNVTGDASGSSGSCTGNAATATNLASARNFSLTGEITASDTSFNGSADCDIATTIADNVVDEANLKVSNSPTNGYFLSAQSGNTGGLTWAAQADSTNASALTSGTLPAARIADDSIVEAKLDIHNTPTDGYVLKYSDSNGLIWEDAGTATNATNVTATANNSTDETTYLTFVDGATGAQGIETDTGLTYNPSSGLLTIGGELDAASLDISGDADIEGTLEADAYTVDGTALNEYIADTVGAMVSSNTESGITVTYQDGDNTLDFTVGTLNQDTTGTAAIATTVTVADESSDTTCFPLFATAATGNLAPKSDSQLTYNSSTGELGCGIIDGGTW